MKVHGLACFETSNGLQASGSGRLQFANKHTELFEFGNPKLGGSEYLSANVPTFFIRKFYYRGILAHLIGIVKKTRDKFGRVGFWGMAAMVDDDKPIQVDIVKSLFQTSDIAHTSTLEERQELYTELLSVNDNFPPGELSQYEDRESLIFSVTDGILSDQILQRCKVLMEIEPSYYSTVIVQLGKVAIKTLGELDDQNFSEISSRLREEADDIQAEIDLENMEPHLKRFYERTEKIGVLRPEIVSPEFEDYLIALIRYVNESVSQKKKR